MMHSPFKYLALAVVCLIIGLAWHSNDIATGLGKAMAGVFMIMFFIVRFFGENEA